MSESRTSLAQVKSLIESINSGDTVLDEQIKNWLQWDKNEDTFGEIKDLLLMKDYEGLGQRLLKRMEFGTAGLRAALGAGFCKMNDVTVIQATQGLCKYLLTQFTDIKSMGVAIGHDARHGSHRFARLTAAVFLHEGIKVYLFSDIVPTPFVPFSVLKYKCAAGVMVTASHNPKEDNGYKVYFSNGAQIIPPHDKSISDHIMANLAPLETSWDIDIHKSSDICIDPLKEVMADYMQSIQTHCHYRFNNKSSSLNITYTAMHGVGAKYEVEAFKAFSLKPFFTTPEQDKPDPDFPTVKYPNPEEGKGALNLAIQTAEAINSPFIIANDPDADRLAIAEKTNGVWKIFTGNEIGLLLGWWSFNNHKNNNVDMYPGDSVYMVHSTVSSRVLQSIGKVEGFKVIETLTGFKWMGNIAHDLIKDGKHVLFAFEEAIGFMFGTQVLDKDGISAGAIVSEMASHLYSKGSTVTKQLDHLYERYGIHISNNSYFICHSQPTIKAIFNRMRTMENGSYPTTVGPFKVVSVRDLTGNGYDSSQPDKKPILPTSSSSEMITFQFDHDCVATIRTSGTEPKIKYYSEISTNPNERLTREEAQAKIDELINNLVEKLLEPEKNNLERRVES